MLNSNVVIKIDYFVHYNTPSVALYVLLYHFDNLCFNALILSSGHLC